MTEIYCTNFPARYFRSLNKPTNRELKQNLRFWRSAQLFWIYLLNAAGLLGIIQNPWAGEERRHSRVEAHLPSSASTRNTKLSWCHCEKTFPTHWTSGVQRNSWSKKTNVHAVYHWFAKAAYQSLRFLWFTKFLCFSTVLVCFSCIYKNQNCKHWGTWKLIN